MPADDAPRWEPQPPFDRWSDIPITDDSSYGSGTYRRRIVVRRVDEGRAVGELEDDFHHFRVELDHDGAEITAVAGTGVRHPWTTCASAGEPLQAVVGTSLEPRASRLGDATNPKLNCTHMFDLAGLVFAHAADTDRSDVRRYDAAVTDPAEDGSQEALVWRDGEPVVSWTVNDEVVAPEPWVGTPLRSKLIAWADENLDPDLAEAVVVLRRALFIANGRVFDLDNVGRSQELQHMMDGICHAFQPHNVTVGVRVKGSGRDFQNHGHLLLADFHHRSS